MQNNSLNLEKKITRVFSYRYDIHTIREINKIGEQKKLSKIFRSYTTLYNLARSGRVPVTKLGNRYLMRIIDIENCLLGNTTNIVAGIRRID